MMRNDAMKKCFSYRPEVDITASEIQRHAKEQKRSENFVIDSLVCLGLAQWMRDSRRKKRR